MGTFMKTLKPLFPLSKGKVSEQLIVMQRILQRFLRLIPILDKRSINFNIMHQKMAFPQINGHFQSILKY